VTRDRQSLQSWYRKAMLRRIQELVALRGAVQRQEPGAGDKLRQIAQALRGSGGTFGFAQLSATAALVETTTDRDAIRRLEGLVAQLWNVAGEGAEGLRNRFDWLGCAAMGPVAGMATRVGEEDLARSWSSVAREAGIDESELAHRVADYLGIEVANLKTLGRAAQRLVPEALMASERIVPLCENSASITIATSEPVSLPLELEIQRLTGRVPAFAVAPPAAIEAVLESLSERRGGAAIEAGQTGASSEARGDRSPGRASAGAAAHPAQPSPAAAELPGPAGGPDPWDGRSVLVVDDEASSRLLVRSLLEKRGFVTIEARDGVEALEAMQRDGSIGLAIVDLNMPRMDGLELIWELRDARQWRHLPVIVVTGEKDEVLETQIMEEGADDYIRKPVDPKLFLARVEATLRRTGVRGST